MKMGSSKRVRCAIYTRVSTDQGLEQDFNSLDAQYDASQSYIRSQAHAGWTLLRAKYDDGGFSGGNTDRPALQRLLQDVRAGKVDIIVNHPPAVQKKYQDDEGSDPTARSLSRRRRLRVSVIVTPGSTAAAAAAKSATTTIPIVFSGGGDPEFSAHTVRCGFSGSRNAGASF